MSNHESDANGMNHPEVRAATILKLQAEARRAEAEALAAERESKANELRLLAEANRLKAESMQLFAEEHKLALELADAKIESEKKARTRQEELSADKYHHIYRFSDVVGDSTVTSCLSTLDQWRRMGLAEGKLTADIPINLIFETSPGGSVMAGLVLLDYLEGAKVAGHPVTTGTLGYAASMAGVLLQAGTKRWAGHGAWVMIHEIATVTLGKVSTVEDDVKFTKRLQSQIVGLYAKRAYGVIEAGGFAGPTDDNGAKRPWSSAQEVVEYIEKHWIRTDWWLSAQECLQMGFVDELR